MDLGVNSSIAKASAGEAFIQLDDHWRIIHLSPEAERLLGPLSESVPGMVCEDLFQVSSPGGVAELKRLCATGAGVCHVTAVLRREGGAGEDYSLTILPLWTREGGFGGAMVMFRRAIEISPLTRLIFDSVADGVFTVDRAWRITSFNQAAEKITGWARGDIIGRSCREVFRSSVCDTGCLLAQSIRQGLPATNKFLFIKRADGSSLPISISAAPLLDSQGKVIGGVETFRDVTALMQYEVILDSIAEGVFTIDGHWGITAFNKAAEKMTGYSQDEVLGKMCHEIFRSSICGQDCAIAQSIRTGAPVQNKTITIQRKDGKELTVGISAAPLVDPDGWVIGAVETFRDLSVEANLRKRLMQQYTFTDIISKSAAMRRHRA